MQTHQTGKFKYHSTTPASPEIRQKTLILYHGWGGSAAGYHDAANELAKTGFRVIVPEIIYHDTREPLAYHFVQKTTQHYFWKTIVESIEEFDSFVTELGIRKEDMVVAGSSMGGFIATGIFAREHKLSGLANINGSGSFLLSEKVFREADGRGEIPDAIEKELTEYDPVKRINSPSPVLLIHGDYDEFVSIEGQKDYYRYLTETGERTNVEFRIYAGVNHVFTDEMVADLAEWLKELN
ncbi:phospholipase [Bacillus sp. MKU004]|nr:phospholipase [Bacillus sp. MKU004]